MRSILLLITIYFIAVSGQNEKPKLILIQDKTEATCVAENNVDSALDFNFTLNDINVSTKIETESFYVYNNTKQKNIICDFENDDHCLDSRHSQNWNRVHAGQHDIAPVTDERWQNFKYYFTNGNQEKIINITKFFSGSKLKIDLSIKTEKDARIALCNNDNPYDNSTCYWILLDANYKKSETNTIIVFRKCLKKIYRLYPKNDLDCASNKNQIKDEINVLTDEEWKHLSLTIDNGKIMLKEASTNNILVEYNDNKPIKNLTHIVFAGYKNNKILWKLHDYSYLSILKSGRIQWNSKQQQKTNCLSLYVALCNKCEIKLKFGNKSQKIENKQGKISKWQHIKLTSENKEEPWFYVEIKNEPNGFWAIDDVRYCNENEIRVSTLKISPDTINENLKSCHLLEDKETIIFSNPPNNPEGTCNNIFFGSNCNITCRSIFGTYCNKKKLCHSRNRCTCFSGYKGDNCEQECKGSSYGYNCKEQCIHCKVLPKDDVVCHAKTGKCKHGCEHGYIGQYCNENIYPRLSKGPNDNEISNTYIILSIDKIPIIGNITDDTKYNIKYKIVDTNNWTLTDKQPISNKIIKITNLKPDTKYIFKAILYSTNDDLEISGDEKISIYITECKVEADISINPEARSATINLIHDNETCNENQYYISLKSEKYHFTNKQREIPMLTPYTNYSITLRNDEKNYTKTTTFQTSEDAPGSVQNIMFSSISHNSGNVTWDPPAEKNGIIRSYNISYQLNKYLLCSENETNQRKYTQNTSNSSILLSNLQPFAAYDINIFAMTILNGSVKTSIFQTEKDESISDDEMPNINIGSERIIIMLPECTKMRGPVNYTFEIKCKSDWCSNEKSNTTIKHYTSQSSNVTMNNLIPYTNYSWTCSAIRFGTDTTINISKEFTTNSSTPSAVRDFVSYSQDDKNIYIRWKPPYPPRGILEKYTISDGYNSKIDIQKHEATKCNLWDDEFYCYSLKYDTIPYRRIITLSVKNEGIDSTKETTITVNKGQSKSNPPMNLKHKSNDQILSLSWNHPSITNGVIKKFLIFFEYNETALTYKPKNIYKTYIIEKEAKDYNFEISTEEISKSTIYIVNVCAVNEKPGDNATIAIITSPEKLKFNDSIKVTEITEATATIIIPPVNLKNISNSFLVILLTKNDNVAEINNITANIHSEADMNRIFSDELKETMVIKFLNIENKQTQFTIGKNNIQNKLNEKFKKYLNTTIENKELSSNTHYVLSLLLCSDYRTSLSCTIEKIDISTIILVNDLIYLLILLVVIIPILGYVCYRKYKFRKLKTKSLSKTNLKTISTDTIELNNVPKNKNAVTKSTETPKILHEKQTKPLVIVKPEIQSKPIKIDKPNQPTINVPETNQGQLNSDLTQPSTSRANLGAQNVIEPRITTQTPTKTYHSKLIKLSDLENYIKNAIETKEIERQHSLFKRGQTESWDYGSLPENRPKNRYKNLVAYDHSRVKLEKRNNDPHSDYINANYINGYKQKNAYIATQGPKDTTTNDFWRMIWQENVKFIIMLTNIIETGKKKCEKYWPDMNETIKYDKIKVTFIHSDLYADFEYRLFEISCGKVNRTVKQYHYTSWPDHGVPAYPQSLVTFIRRMLEIPHSSPTVVHCSAGVGRTGTIILSDICLRMAAREGAVDCLRYLHEIRDHRPCLVDNSDQYKLVHLVLLECLNNPTNTIQCSNLKNEIENLIKGEKLEIQLKYLEHIAWQDNVFDKPLKCQIHPENMNKNRFQNIVPEEERIYIPKYPTNDEFSDYINAIPVDGFKFKNQYIVTQIPLPNTIQDFWKMVINKNSKIIVSLNEIPSNDETCDVFWPKKNEEIHLECGISLSDVSLQTDEYYDIITLHLHDKHTDERSKIYIVQYNNWSHDQNVPEDMTSFVVLCDEVEKLSRGKYPTIVMCYDGATACGLFIGHSFIVEKMKLEQEVDSYLALRVIRRNRKQFINNLEQLQYLYLCAMHYLNMNDIYANFN